MVAIVPPEMIWQAPEQNCRRDTNLFDVDMRTLGGMAGDALSKIDATHKPASLVP